MIDHMQGLNHFCPRKVCKVKEQAQPAQSIQRGRKAFKECKRGWESNKSRLASWFPDNIINDCHGSAPQK